MPKKKITIINKLGLHARAASKMVSVASRFASDIELAKDDKKINAKSIMAVMMLGATKGTELEVSVNGEDETEAMKAIEALIKDRFGEAK